MVSLLGWGEILLGTLVPVGRGLGEVLFLEALNQRSSSAFRATVISMANLGIRASFCLLAPLVGYGVDGWGLPSVLSALGILFPIAFAFLPPAAGPEPGRQTQGVTHFPSTRRAMIRALSDHPAASLESLAETPIVSGIAQPADRCAVPVPSFASPK